jgi:hypothetical protein
MFNQNSQQKGKPIRCSILPIEADSAIFLRSRASRFKIQALPMGMSMILEIV